MANVIVIKKPEAKMATRSNSGVIRVDSETLAILRDMSFQARMSIGAMAANLIKYAAADTVIEIED